MDTSKNPNKVRRSPLPTRDLEPRNGHAVTGGKKAVSELKTTQQQIESTLQELQGSTASSG